MQQHPYRSIYILLTLTIAVFLIGVYKGMRPQDLQQSAYLDGFNHGLEKSFQRSLMIQFNANCDACYRCYPPQVSISSPDTAWPTLSAH